MGMATDTGAATAGGKLPQIAKLAPGTPASQRGINPSPGGRDSLPRSLRLVTPIVPEKNSQR